MKKLEIQEQLSANQWDATYNKGEHYLNEDPSDFVIAAILNYRKEFPSNLVLDVGCGNGRNFKYIVNEGFDAYGIDISIQGIKQLKQSFPNRLESSQLSVGSFYSLPYKDNFFGAALSISVYQHNDWEGAIKSFKELHRVLQIGGIGIISIRSTSRDVPVDAQFITDKGISFISNQGSKAGVTIHHFSKKELGELCRMNDFEILSIKEHLKIKNGINKAHFNFVVKKIK